MSLEANKDLIRRYFAAIDAACQTGNADILDEFLAPDFVEHNPFPGIPPTRDGWKQAFLMFDAATPGYHVVEDVLAEGDQGRGTDHRLRHPRRRALRDPGHWQVDADERHRDVAHCRRQDRRALV